MYSLTRNSTRRDLVVVEAPSFAVSLIVANIFFQWHSFALELAGFLALWYVTSGAIKWLDSKFGGSNRPASS